MRRSTRFYKYRTTQNFAFLICLSLSIFSRPLLAAKKVFQSGASQVALIELYSSEGCSSCPPADKWFAKLKNKKNLWQDFVPIAFHVDYWNYLGWTDRFSHKQFTQRQRAMARQWGTTRIYTPGFVKNGEEWRQRDLNNLRGDYVGNLRVEQVETGVYKVLFSPENKAPRDYSVHMVLMGHGLKTDVKFGENAGSTLRHEFIVLKKTKSVMKRRVNQYSADLKLRRTTQARPTAYSVGIWVTAGKSLAPIQATGGYL